MKNLKSLLLGILATTAIYSCGDKDEAPTKNQAPSQPKLVSPQQGAMDVDVNPTFKWEESVDPEKSAVSYEIYVSKDENFTENQTIKAIDVEDSFYSFTNKELEHSTKYYWKVVASDKDKEKSVSPVYNFTTIGENLKITLLEPSKNAVLDTNETTIKWEVKRNSIFNKEVTYSVYLRNGSDEFSTPFKTKLKETEVHLSDLKGNGKYYWMVKAMDGNDVVAESDVFVFTTPNTIPTPAKIKDNPKQTFVDDKVNVVFEWTESEDPDRIFENGTLRAEKLTYDFYLSETNTFTDDNIKEKALTELTYSAMGLEPNKDYWAKVVTKDETGGKAESLVFKLTTKELPKTGDLKITEGTWVDDRDQKTYKTVTINGTTWLAENFAYLPYVEEEENGETKTCYVYGMSNTQSVTEHKNSPNYKKYGVLYNVYAFKDIVPKGWHVATDDDWKKLEKLSGMEDGQIDATGYRDRGTTMHKFIALDEPFSTSQPTDEMKTSVKYGGYYKSAAYNGGVRGEGTYTYIWTSTTGKQLFTTGNFFRAFSKARTAIERGVQVPKYGMYVRLVKNK